MLYAAGWIASALLLAAAAPPPDSAAAITKRIEEKMKAFHGEIGLFAKDLDTGAMVSVNGDKRFPTASLIKVAVMAEVFRQIDGGQAPARHDGHAERVGQGGRRDRSR